MDSQPKDTSKGANRDPGNARDDQSHGGPRSDIQQHLSPKEWHPEEQEHKRQERIYWCFQEVTTVITLGLSLIAAAAAIVGAVIAYRAFMASTDAVREARRQAKAAEDQVGIQADTEKRQLRAYVFISEGSLNNFGTSAQMDAGIKIKNSGQTPAYKLIARIIITFADFPARTLPNPVADKPSMDLGPGSDFTLRTTAARPLTSDEHGKVIGSTSAIYAYGEYSYIDAFSRCWLHFFKTYFGGNNAITSDGALHPYSDGNYETECNPDTREPLVKE